MEPANLNSPSDRGDDRLESLLRTPAPPLPDDGFSTRVLAALPSPVRHAPRFARPAVARWCGAVAILGTLTAISLAAPWSEFQTAFAPVTNSLTEPAVIISLIVALGSTGYALWPSFIKRSA